MITFKIAFAIGIFCMLRCDGAKVLCYFNIPLYSRHAAFQSLTNELARRGHEVTVLTTRPQPPDTIIENLREIDISSPSQNHRPTKLLSEKNKYGDYRTAFRILASHFQHDFERQLQSRAVQEVLRSDTKYDILILDSSYSCPTLALSHVFRIPVVLIRGLTSNTREYEATRAEQHTLFYPYIMGRKHSTNVIFWDVARQLFNDYEHRQLDLEGEIIVDEILSRHFGLKMPPLAELWMNVRGVIVNAHWIWDNNRPVPTNVEYVGNMHVEAEKKLPEDIQAYLDSSEHGVIYVSFGSIFDFSTLSQAKIDIFLNVFSTLPYGVLLKCKKDIKRPDNVRIYRWLPQANLLKHPKIKLFITQGGLHSTNEAITAGVPLLGVPMYSDQWYNVEQYLKHKIGLKVYLESLNEAHLVDSIEAIINDPSYAAATIQMRSRLHRRFPPVERAALLIERVLKQSAQDKPRPENHRSFLLTLAIMASVVILLLGYLMKTIIMVLRKLLQLM